MKYIDIIITVTIVGIITVALAEFTKAKKAEYAYYIFARHVAHHQLIEMGCDHLTTNDED